MTLERFVVRSFLTALAVAISACFFPFMLLLKLVEGVYVGIKITASCITQVWRSPGIPELDGPFGAWLEKRNAHDVPRREVRK